MASGLTKAERQKLIPLGQAASLYAQVMKEPVALLPHLPLVTRAIDISSRTRSGYYDCIYLVTGVHAPVRTCYHVLIDIQAENPHDRDA